jgi:hypothetical protein
VVQEAHDWGLVIVIVLVAEPVVEPAVEPEMYRPVGVDMHCTAVAREAVVG